jgi:hypothetical protein
VTTPEESVVREHDNSELAEANAKIADLEAKVKKVRSTIQDNCYESHQITEWVGYEIYILCLDCEQLTDAIRALEEVE